MLKTSAVLGVVLLLMLHVGDFSEAANPCNSSLVAGKVDDSQLSASSSYGGLLPKYGRLLGSKAWLAQANAKHQWFQVDLAQTAKVTQVSIQGRPDADQWVTTYTLSYSRDGRIWERHQEGFVGSHDRKTVSSRTVSPPIIARFVRIHPKTWHGWIAMRVDLRGCTSGFCIPIQTCIGALGMADKRIPDARITASSSYAGATYQPQMGRLHGSGFWLPHHSDKDQFLQIDLGELTETTRIATQGRSNAQQWVKHYHLEYSHNDGFYQDYAPKAGKYLPGNTNNQGVATNILQPPIIARYIRIVPADWQSYIALRVELYGCTKGFVAPAMPTCLNRLAMADDQMSASSEYDVKRKASNARLHHHAFSTKAGGWIPRTSDVHQFIEVDFRKATKVTAVATQGREEQDQWVISYTLSYSLDGGVFTDYTVDDKVKEFSGNDDRYTVVSHMIVDPPIIARYIRLHPKKWRTYIAMRLEFYGCTDGFVPPAVPKCLSPLGLRTGLVPDSKMTASSELNSLSKAANGRLYSYLRPGHYGTWIPRTQDNQQWLQVDFGKIVKIRRVATQGRQDYASWTKTYTLEYSRDGVFWENYQQGDTKRVFSGNSDQFTTVFHNLAPAIIARFVRIHPQTWKTYVSLRAELYGCREGFTVPPTDCADALGMESGSIPDSRLTASSTYSSGYDASHARLRVSKTAWLPKYADRGQWVQVDLGQVTKVTRIATQGRYNVNQWVKSYTLFYSRDGGYFAPYDNHQTLHGNKDYKTVVGHILEPAIISQFVRVQPLTWYSYPALRLELYGCTSGFSVPQTHTCHAKIKVTDKQMSSSSSYNAQSKASSGRLHQMVISGKKTGGWIAQTNDKYQYLQEHFSQATKVTRVATQGRHAAAQWVTKYWLEYSLDGSLFVAYAIGGVVKVFEGNTDQHKVVSHVIDPPIIARYIRVRPKTWHGHIVMRVEFYGCTKGFEPPPAETECILPLGCQCVGIKDSQFSASSTLKPLVGAANARLHAVTVHGKVGAWEPAANNVNQWIQVDFEGYKTIRRIATQGRQDRDVWVESYKVQYSQDGKVFKTYREYNKDKVFTGNHDRGTVRLNGFTPPLKNVRFLRVVPLTWHGKIALRLEVYGCQGDVPKLVLPCTQKLDVGIIVDRSGSVGPWHFRSAKRFLSILVNRLTTPKRDNRVGIITMGTTSTLIPPGFVVVNIQNTDALHKMITNMPYIGDGTRIDRALAISSSNLFLQSSGDQARVLVVMTDGGTAEGSTPYSDVLKPLVNKRSIPPWNR